METKYSVQEITTVEGNKWLVTISKFCCGRCSSMLNYWDQLKNSKKAAQELGRKLVKVQ
jgi:hypothetical protein